MSFYLVDSRSSVDTFSKFSEVKISTRYKLAEKGSLLIDPILYLEYKIKTDRTDHDLLEGKLILAKDYNKLNVALNLIAEQEYEVAENELEWEYEYKAGVSYPIYKETSRVGIEIAGGFGEAEITAGPTLSLKGKTVWGAIGSLYGIQDNQFKARMIIGLLL